jgi:metal-sulfur cluster biosynthetic enzyme
MISREQVARALRNVFDPEIGWRKLQALSEGAALASKTLWS